MLDFYPMYKKVEDDFCKNNYLNSRKYINEIELTTANK